MTTSSCSVLVISGRDPEPHIAGYLSAQGFRVTLVAGAGAVPLEGCHRFYDCVVLDLGPDDAVAMTRALRATSTVPIVVIAATKELTERVDALDAGADDCVARPLSERELQFRILASVRRVRGGPQHP